MLFQETLRLSTSGKSSLKTWLTWWLIIGTYHFKCLIKHMIFKQPNIMYYYYHVGSYNFPFFFFFFFSILTASAPGEGRGRGRAFIPRGRHRLRPRRPPFGAAVEAESRGGASSWGRWKWTHGPWIVYCMLKLRSTFISQHILIVYYLLSFFFFQNCMWGCFLNSNLVWRWIDLFCTHAGLPKRQTTSPSRCWAR